MGSELLRRVRWRNVGRACGAVLVVAAVVAWPRLNPPTPRLPDPAARPLLEPTPEGTARPPDESAVRSHDENLVRPRDEPPGGDSTSMDRSRAKGRRRSSPRGHIRAGRRPRATEAPGPARPPDGGGPPHEDTEVVPDEPAASPDDPEDRPAPPEDDPAQREFGIEG